MGRRADSGLARRRFSSSGRRIARNCRQDRFEYYKHVPDAEKTAVATIRDTINFIFHVNTKIEFRVTGSRRARTDYSSRHLDLVLPGWFQQMPWDVAKSLGVVQAGLPMPCSSSYKPATTITGRSVQFPLAHMICSIHRASLSTLASARIVGSKAFPS